MTVVQPREHTLPIGRYSPAIKVPVGDGASLLYISGQVASDGDGACVSPGDAEGQADYVFDKLEAVLAAAGSDLGSLVSLCLYVLDMRDFPAISAVRNRRLERYDVSPSSTLVEVSSLAIPEHLIEISAIAYLET